MVNAEALNKVEGQVLGVGAGEADERPWAGQECEPTWRKVGAHGKVRAVRRHISFTQ